MVVFISSALDDAFPNPGVSTKQMFRSRMESDMLFLLRGALLSSMSVHQGGYAFVLACISVILAVLESFDLLFRDLDLGDVLGLESGGDNGST